MLKQVFLARFEPVLIEFSSFHHMYAPLCALRTYLKAVWWSHLELGEGCRLEDIYIYIYIYIYYMYIYIYIYIYGEYVISPPPTPGQPVHYEARLGTPPPILGSGDTKKHVLEVNWMGITGYLPLYRAKMAKIGV